MNRKARRGGADRTERRRGVRVGRWVGEGEGEQKGRSPAGRTSHKRAAQSPGLVVGHCRAASWSRLLVGVLALNAKATGQGLFRLKQKAGRVFLRLLSLVDRPRPLAPARKTRAGDEESETTACPASALSHIPANLPACCLNYLGSSTVTHHVDGGLVQG